MAEVMQARGVAKRYQDQWALNGIDLDVHEGDVLALIGPSGSGKSTFLRCINDLERPDKGYILLDGELVGLRTDDDGRLRRRTARGQAAMRRTTGMVFQQFNLFPHMTALENVCFGPRVALRTSRDTVLTKALTLLDRVGLAEKAHRYPHQLSGGQQQRVGIARALAMEPRLMLFDEPTSALDPELIGEVLEVIRELSTEQRTMVIVTHELRFAVNVANRVAFLSEGQVVEEGSPDQVILNPQHQRTARFVEGLTTHG